MTFYARRSYSKTGVRSVVHIFFESVTLELCRKDVIEKTLDDPIEKFFNTDEARKRSLERLLS